jgi:hypothetical protein
VPLGHVDQPAEFVGREIIKRIFLRQSPGRQHRPLEPHSRLGCIEAHLNRPRRVLINRHKQAVSDARKALRYIGRQPGLCITHRLLARQCRFGCVWSDCCHRQKGATYS